MAIHAIIVDAFVGVVFYDPPGCAANYSASRSSPPGAFLAPYHGAEQGSAGSTPCRAANYRGPATRRALRLGGAIRSGRAMRENRCCDPECNERGGDRCQISILSVSRHFVTPGAGEPFGLGRMGGKAGFRNIPEELGIRTLYQAHHQPLVMPDNARSTWRSYGPTRADAGIAATRYWVAALRRCAARRRQRAPFKSGCASLGQCFERTAFGVVTAAARSDSGQT
jgi:hypothetical protein